MTQPPAAAGKLTPRQILTAMSGLVVAMLLAQLDNMIVAPALPTIVGDLGGLAHLSWVVTGYILASTVSTPIWGKLGDLFGHKHAFMASIVLFLVGSALCGMSQSMTELVLFRAFQGVGAGGLMVGIMSVIGMLVSPRERGKYIGVMMAVMPAAMIAGPLIGGWITDNASWRWAFYVNLPLGILALFVVWSTLHLTAEVKAEGKVEIDWSGSAVLVVWLTALVLMITWGGTQYPWGSWQVVTLGVVAAVGVVAFLAIEHRAAEPIIPLRLFGSMNFSLSTALGFVAGFAMFGGITFLPQFQQLVQGASATNSGLLLMPMMLSAMVFSLGGGQVMSRTGHYKAFPIVGTILLTSGMWLFSTMTVDTSKSTTAFYMVLLGAGMGCLMQTTNLIAQNSVAIRDLGAATGTATFTRNLGGSLGVSILGAIYAHELLTHLSGLGGGQAHSVGNTSTLTPKVVESLPEQVRSVVQHAVVAGTHEIFWWAALISVAGVVLAWFVKQVPLRDTVLPTAPESVEEAAESFAV
ncbi:MDR family MFS transporter [Nocardioides terrisoli]|uniref:MDR family MFS transporter n=1 Tax=Nocardioides terrisoli TaxID=3388267 RepID=UPI00287B8913|nr:MDR family MFS transporter [Nocardioides marmorisolisilvae]